MGWLGMWGGMRRVPTQQGNGGARLSFGGAMSATILNPAVDAWVVSSMPAKAVLRSSSSCSVRVVSCRCLPSRHALRAAQVRLRERVPVRGMKRRRPPLFSFFCLLGWVTHTLRGLGRECRTMRMRVDADASSVLCACVCRRCGYHKSSECIKMQETF